LEQPVDVEPQPPHPSSNARLLVIVTPLPIKSILIGFACSNNSLSTTYLKPLISYVLSLSFGSSRANAREGPPHPLWFKKTRIAENSLSLSCSVICFVADSVTSNIKSSFCICNNLYHSPMDCYFSS